MPVKVITSKDNPEFRALRNLAEHPRSRRDTGLTLLDGWHLIEAAHQAGWPLEKLLLADTLSDSIPPAPLSETIPRMVLSEALMRALSPVKTPSGWMAVIRIPRPVAGHHASAVLLEDIQDPGNLGALLRTAAAAGIETAYLSPACADAWSPKALRGGQGAHFRLSIYERADLPMFAGEYEAAYAAALGASDSLFDLDLRGRVAFAFGNEGAGLSAELRAACRPFVIPMPGAMESLNVAAAAAVCLFERVRQLKSENRS